MRKNVFLISAAVAATFTFGASAQVKADAAIEYRHSVFEVIGWNFKPMAAMVKGEAPYDKEAFAKRAANVATMAPMALEGFAPGTEKGDKEKTQAKPAIWEKMDDFKGKMSKLAEESTKLAAISKTGTFDEIKKQFGATGAACKACHDDYKQK